MSPIEILYHDDAMVAVSKPSGMPVHRSSEHRDADQVLLQTLRDQIGARVYPVHRLDRPASGVIVFALSSESARLLQEALDDPGCIKRYLALVRGAAAPQGESRRPLTQRDTGRKQEAHTSFLCLESFSAGAGYGTVSLLEVRIMTGRRHQIRRHLAHMKHQILGDTTHGKGRINRHMRDAFALQRIFLHAWRLDVRHPESGERLELRAELPEGLSEVLRRLAAGQGSDFLGDPSEDAAARHAVGQPVEGPPEPHLVGQVEEDGPPEKERARIEE